MSRVRPIPPAELPPELRPVLEFAQQTMGFTPNDVLIMARWPELLQAMAPVVGAVFSPGTAGMELKRLVALVASSVAGCQYCVAHNALGLGQEGIAADRLAAVWDFEHSPLFSAAERAALRLARGAAQQPCGLTEREFAGLREHFDDRQILELVAVIALFGFLNRWNAALATTLEPEPLAFARASLPAGAWEPGPHAG